MFINCDKAIKFVLGVYNIVVFNGYFSVRFQIFGKNKTITVSISSRPHSMSADKIHFVIVGKCSYVAAITSGLPNEGPTFEIAEMEEVSATIISISSKVIIRLLTMSTSM